VASCSAFAGKQLLLKWGVSGPVATVLPPLALSTMVQFVNMPIVRASVTIQNPANNTPNIVVALVRVGGCVDYWRSLWCVA
jgi:hypothetical protein